MTGRSKVFEQDLDLAVEDVIGQREAGVAVLGPEAMVVKHVTAHLSNHVLPHGRVYMMVGTCRPRLWKYSRDIAKMRVQATQPHRLHAVIFSLFFFLVQHGGGLEQIFDCTEPCNCPLWNSSTTTQQRSKRVDLH